MNLWIPLFFLYLLLAPIFLLLLPIAILIGIAMWLSGSGKTPFSLMVWIYELWCAASGITIETKSKSERVLIHIL